MRIALAQINPTVGALTDNVKKILMFIREAKQKGVELLLFPEMALLGYPPEDLLLLPSFIQAVEEALQSLLSETVGIVVILGTIRLCVNGEKGLYNSAAIIQEGELLGFHDKILLPDYDVFSERRYFEPGGPIKTWSLLGKRVAVTICEDIWQHAHAVEHSTYARDPIQELKGSGVELLLNLSASPFFLGRKLTRYSLCQSVARALHCPLFFANQVGANDSLLFDGHSMVLKASGELAASAAGFKEELLIWDSEQSGQQIPPKRAPEPIEELYQALVMGLRDYFKKQGLKKACLGLSGGIDSALVACIAVEALGAENVLAFSLPSPYSSLEPQRDSAALAEHLGITLHTLPIDPLLKSFAESINPLFPLRSPSLTEENLQARIRGCMLMACSNEMGYTLLNTGNKSEMAMGYMTLYGDMCGGLAVLGDVRKEQVYALARSINREKVLIPEAIIEREPSAELRPGQKDSDTLPPYSLIDQVLIGYVEEHLSAQEITIAYGLPLEQVQQLIQRIHLNEYKRRQAPLSLRVTKKAFAVGRRFPIVQKWNL